MEGPTSSCGSRNRIKCLTLQEHDNDDDDDGKICCVFAYIFWNSLLITHPDTSYMCSLMEDEICKASRTNQTIHKRVQFWAAKHEGNTGLFEMNVGVLKTCHTQYTWDTSIGFFLFLSMGLRQGSGLCSSSSRKYPWTESTNQNSHWNHHCWHATDSLERTGLSCWCF